MEKQKAVADIDGLKRKKAVDFLTILLLILSVCSVTVLSCLFVYKYDNKYTFSGPKGSQGVVRLTEYDSYQMVILTEGWEYYVGQLLEPSDFVDNVNLNKEYIYIGQYVGFEDGNDDSPHGSATYRLVIEIPDELRNYTLELTEVFSAYKLYINNNLIAEMGNPDPRNYEAKTLNTSVSFMSKDRIEIVIAVSDFSHFYSGMVYPPIFGEQNAVSQIIFLRFFFRAALCASALIIGAISILVGFFRRKDFTAVLYGLLCLFFVGYISYPIVKTFFSEYYPFYALENISFIAMIVVVMLIQGRLCMLKGKLRILFPFMGVLVCFVSIALHAFLPNSNTLVLYAYSYMISAFQWITAIYLTVSAAYAIYKKILDGNAILIGIIVFDTSLIMDRLLPVHEPIITGWFIELASFVLVISIGIVLGKEIAEQYALNNILEERARSMNRLLQTQRTYYPLMQEEIEKAKTARHDLKHHLLVINGFVDTGNYDGLKKYLLEYQKGSSVPEQISYCKNEIADILAHYYMCLAKEHNIKLIIRLDIDSDVKIKEDDLCALLSNLLENAVEACILQKYENKYITLTAKTQSSVLAFTMENSCNKAEKTEKGFISLKKKERTGYGLDSIKAIAKSYNGTVEFKFNSSKKIFYSYVVLEI